MEANDVIIKFEPKGDPECSVKLKPTEAVSSSIYKDLPPSTQLSLKDTEKVESTSKEIEEMESIQSIKTKSEIAKENVTSPSSTSPQEILSCTVCPQTFSKILDFKKHMRSHTSELLYDCHLCVESFEVPKDLKFHIKYHHENSGSRRRRTYKCEICSVILGSAETFRNHQLIHTGEKPFECKICGNRFRHRNSFVRHGWQHVENKDRSDKIKCNICQKNFPTTAQLKTHQASHSGAKNYACPSCDKAFFTLNRLKGHVRTHTGDQLHKCELCPMTFKEKDKLDDHQRVVHNGENSFSCSMCGKKFAWRHCLKRHVNKMHIVTEDSKDIRNSGPVTCKICSQVLQNECNLRKHMRRHTGDGANKCDICHIFFVHKVKYDRHMKEGLHRKKNENKIRRFKCEFCPAAFKCIKHLRIHSRLHTGERPYSCSICGRKFIQKSGLNRHMAKQHTHKKDTKTNVKCHICSKTFLSYAELKPHLESHNTEDRRGYKCGLCNIFIVVRPTFEKHMQQHEQLSCKICKLDFPTESAFQVHLEKHWDINPKCHNCGKTCDSHKDLSIHFMKSHTLPRIYLEKCCKI